MTDDMICYPVDDYVLADIVWAAYADEISGILRVLRCAARVSRGLNRIARLVLERNVTALDMSLTLSTQLEFMATMPEIRAIFSTCRNLREINMDMHRLASLYHFDLKTPTLDFERMIDRNRDCLRKVRLYDWFYNLSLHQHSSECAFVRRAWLAMSRCQLTAIYSELPSNELLIEIVNRCKTLQTISTPNASTLVDEAIRNYNGESSSLHADSLREVTQMCVPLGNIYNKHPVDQDRVGHRQTVHDALQRALHARARVIDEYCGIYVTISAG